ncbi:hypothetical protein EON83_15090 [bacterium]|nr:MAG: hypothetical protein EON83_15090 [bacterium]
MKIVARIGLAGVLLAGSFGGSAVLAAPEDAAPKVAVPAPIPVTRDNFVSLSWRQTGGFAGITNTTLVEGNVISRGTPRPRAVGATGEAQSSSRVLSNKQLNQLVDKVREANLPTLVGNYRQQGLMDGFNEVLVLTLSDDEGADQEYIIQNYGNKAPKAYYEFTGFFREFVNKKFAPRA